MIVILHHRTCSTIADTTKNDLLKAFAGHADVFQVEAESAGAWPTPPAWDDLLVVVFDGSPFPGSGSEFITEYLKQQNGQGAILPVAVDSTSQKPPMPVNGIKALLHDATAVGERGRLANRVGGMLGLRVQGRHTKIFISYRAVDGRAIANQINTHLNRVGYPTFLDEAKEFDHEPSILPGSDVQKEIDAALDTANLVLLLDTPKAFESPWIKHEVDTAESLFIPVLPVCFREAGDPKKATRFRTLVALQRWVLLATPPPTADPLTNEQLEEIVAAAESYICEIFRRKCRVPFIVKSEFESQGFGWTVLSQRLLMFKSSKAGGRIATNVLSHTSIFDDIYVPAIERFQKYLDDAGHMNYSLFIYDGVVLPNREVQELGRDYAEVLYILHHQELAALIKSHFTMLGQHECSHAQRISGAV